MAIKSVEKEEVKFVENSKKWLLDKLGGERALEVFSSLLVKRNQGKFEDADITSENVAEVMGKKPKDISERQWNTIKILLTGHEVNGEYEHYVGKNSKGQYYITKQDIALYWPIRKEQQQHTEFTARTSEWLQNELGEDAVNAIRKLLETPEEEDVDLSDLDEDLAEKADFLAETMKQAKDGSFFVDKSIIMAYRDEFGYSANKKEKTEEKAADAKASNNDWDVPEFKGVTAKKTQDSQWQEIKDEEFASAKPDWTEPDWKSGKRADKKEEDEFAVRSIAKEKVVVKEVKEEKPKPVEEVSSGSAPDFKRSEREIAAPKPKELAEEKPKETELYSPSPDIKARNQQVAKLVLSAGAGNLAVVKEVLEVDSTLVDQVHNGVHNGLKGPSTALIEAVKNRKYDIVEYLVSKGAKPENPVVTPSGRVSAEELAKENERMKEILKGKKSGEPSM
ncbi:MAG: hypothetical protein AABX38_02655 [Candidatus Micrarchaeota archaeon]